MISYLQVSPATDLPSLFFSGPIWFVDPQGSYDPIDIAAIKRKKLRVLLIDDDDDLREALRFELSRQFSAQVTDVKSGLAAIELVSEGGKFDLVFLDIMMTEMNGLDTYHKLEPIKGTECMIVIMSAYSESLEWEKAKSLGLEVVSKPIPENKLVFLLNKAGADVT